MPEEYEDIVVATAMIGILMRRAGLTRRVFSNHEIKHELEHGRVLVASAPSDPTVGFIVSLDDAAVELSEIVGGPLAR